MMDTERLESDREFREAISPHVVELCAVCRERPEKCECQANTGQRRQQVARAAAPDLLEALEGLREVVRSSLLPAMNEAAKHLPEGHYARQWSVSDDLDFQQAARKTDNAIAKARGENHDE